MLCGVTLLEKRMKIEGNGPQIDPRMLERLEKAAGRTQPEAGSSAKPGSGTDEVRLSPEAQLALAANAAVQQEPAIRQDVVEKMKALLDKGEIGNDPHKLADALINSWLNS